MLHREAAWTRLREPIIVQESSIKDEVRMRQRHLSAQGAAAGTLTFVIDD